MRSLVRALLAAALLAVLGGASAAIAAPKGGTTTDVPVEKATTPPADAKTSTSPAKKPDLCDFVEDILSRTRFPDGTTPEQIKQHVIAVLSATRLPDGVDVTKPIDSCLPGATMPGKSAPTKGEKDTKPSKHTDPGPGVGSGTRSARPGTATAAPSRAVTPNFAG